MQSDEVFNKLESFKSWMQDEFMTHCFKTYGEMVTQTCILPHIETMMENFEYTIEQYGQEAVMQNDDALCFATNIEGE